MSPKRLEEMKTEELMQADVNKAFQLARINVLLNGTEPRVLQNYAVQRFLQRAVSLFLTWDVKFV